MEDEFEKRMSVKFIQTLNRHLPRKRKTLKELLLEEKPVIEGIDGSIHTFDKSELEKLASKIQVEEHDKLRLPIYLEMSSSMERGSIRISGKLECRIINSILHEGDKKAKAEERDSMVIYYPYLTKIRKELSTSTQFMFTM